MTAVVILFLNLGMVISWRAGAMVREYVFVVCVFSVLALIALVIHHFKSRETDIEKSIGLALTSAFMLVPANAATSNDWFQGAVSIFCCLMGLAVFVRALVVLFRERGSQET